MSEPALSTGAPSVAARLDRLPLTRTHRVAVVIVGLGLFFDAYENFLAATIAKVLQNDFALGGTGLKLVLASAFVGQFLGAMLMGRLADRFGRRPAFLINLALYSVASLVGAFSPDATFLVVTRFIAGIGIGAEYALADSYLSDVLPRRAPRPGHRVGVHASASSGCRRSGSSPAGWCRWSRSASPAGAGCSCSAAWAPA